MDKVKHNKKYFIQTILSEISSGQKIKVVKLLLETSRNKKNGNFISLRKCKDFMDEHFVATEENAELMWKFAKGKLK